MILENNEFLRDTWERLATMMTIETFVKMAVVYFFVIWISILVWVIRDITNRTDSLFLQFLSILIVLLLTPFWVFIYLLVRPTKTLFERYYEEIEVNLESLAETIQTKLKTKKDTLIKCPCCEYPIENAFKFCPNCKEELKYSCKSCDKKIDKDWKVCAHCGEKKPYNENAEKKSSDNNKDSKKDKQNKKKKK